MTTTAHTEQPIKVGGKWEQRTTTPDGTVLKRVVEIIARPTLSAPVGIRIVRNDAHPHRVGRTASIRATELRRKYQAVSA